MKKTIIALLALGGVALGANSVEKDITLSGEAASFGASFDLTQSWTMTMYIPSFTSNGDTTSIFKSSFVDVSVLNTESTIAVSIPDASFSSTSVEDVDTLKNLATTQPEWWYMYPYGMGAIQLNYNDANGNFTVGVYSQYNGSLQAEVVSATYPGLEFSNSVDFEQITGLSGTRVTFQGVESSVPSSPSIPEPTTATLSLLALAGLAARRRRK